MARIAPGCWQLVRVGSSERGWADSTGSGLSRTSRLGRSGRRRNSERDDDGAEPNLIAVAQRRPRGDALTTKIRSVLASEILDRRVGSFQTDARMMSRYTRRIDPDASIGRASQDVVAWT